MHLVICYIIYIDLYFRFQTYRKKMALNDREVNAKFYPSRDTFDFFHRDKTY